MKKRTGRPSRFTMIANEAIDDESLDLTQLGLHTFLVRCKDGYDIDMDTLAKRRGPGRRVLYAAMRALVERAYVVKIKYQGERGRWATDVFVYDTPAAREEIAEALEDYAEAKSVRIEPEWIDPREGAPDTEKPQVAPACHNRQVGDRQVGDRQVGDRQVGDRQVGKRQVGDRQVGKRQVGKRQAKDRKTNTQTDTNTVPPSVPATGSARDVVTVRVDGGMDDPIPEEATQPTERKPVAPVPPSEGVLLLRPRRPVRRGHRQRHPRRSTPSPDALSSRAERPHDGMDRGPVPGRA